MDTQLQIAIITTLLTALGGVVGYAIREYLNKVRPFIVVERIESGVTKENTYVDVPVTIVEAIKSSFKIRELAVSEKLRTIEESRDDCRDIIENGPPFLNLIKKIVDYSTVDEKKETINILSKIISTRFYEELLVNIIISDRVDVPDLNPELKTVIPVEYSGEKNDGTLWIGFPRNRITFGWNFAKYPLHRQICEKFVGLIQTLHSIPSPIMK